MLGISADRPAHGSFVKICKRAVNDDGSAVDDRQIHELLHTETGQQPSRLILQFRDDNGTLRRISLLPCPVAPQNATDQSGMVIFLQES
jgi:hypothetical protein